MEIKNKSQTTNIKLLLCGKVTLVSYCKKEIWHNTPYSKLKKNNQTKKKGKVVKEKQDVVKRSTHKDRNNVYNLVSINTWLWKKYSNSTFWPSFLTLTFKEDIKDAKPTAKQPRQRTKPTTHPTPPNPRRKVAQYNCPKKIKITSLLSSFHTI